MAQPPAARYLCSEQGATGCTHDLSVHGTCIGFESWDDFNRTEPVRAGALLLGTLREKFAAVLCGPTLSGATCLHVWDESACALYASSGLGDTMSAVLLLSTCSQNIRGGVLDTATSVG